MKNLLKAFLLAIVLLPCVMMFTACDNGGDNNDDNTDKINANDNTGTAAVNPFDGIQSGNVYNIYVMEGTSVKAFTSYNSMILSADKNTWEEITQTEYTNLPQIHYDLMSANSNLSVKNTPPPDNTKVGTVWGHYEYSDEKYYKVAVASSDIHYQKIEVNADGTLTAKTYKTEYNTETKEYETTEQTYKISGTSEVLRIYNDEGKLTGIQTAFINIDFFVEE